MEKKSYLLNLIVKWFLDYGNKNNVVLSKDKLCMLLYYAKGFYYIACHEELFSENIIKIDSGVDVQGVCFDDLDNVNLDGLEDKIKIVLEFVYEKVGVIDEEKLLSILKNETLYQNCECGYQISGMEIESFFKSIYIEPDEVVSEFDITGGDIFYLVGKLVLNKYNDAFKALAKL